jgi:formate/nitrite transporter
MSYLTPAEVAASAVKTGVAKAAMPAPKAFVGGILAGAYIAFGALLAIVASSGLSPSVGGVTTLITGLTFALGLILVVVAGGELLTGNMMYVAIAAFRGEVSIGKLLLNWLWVGAGNLVGSLVVAYVFADKTGVIKEGAAGTAGASWTRLAAIAMGKAGTETHLEQFLRAIACNWLVCLAVWIAVAATSVSGKILGIVFPITAFVAMGFDHVVANMFFLPLAQFLSAGGVTTSETVLNLVFAFLGNTVGGALFVGGAYWYLYLQGTDSTAAAKQG